MTVAYDAERRQLIVRPDSKPVEQRLPVTTWVHEEDYSLKTRRALVPFENRWELSIIWGGATYSTNHDYYVDHLGLMHPEGSESQPFVETPATVEVGVIVPEPITKPAPMTAEAAAALREWSPDLPEVPQSMLEPYATRLWGDPLTYVDADQLLLLADVVARLPSHPDPVLLDDVDFYDLVGFLATVVERFGVAPRSPR
jgi:hypothetical protein